MRLDTGCRRPEDARGATVPVRERVDGRVGYPNGGGLTVAKGMEL